MLINKCQHHNLTTMIYLNNTVLKNNKPRCDDTTTNSSSPIMSQMQLGEGTGTTLVVKYSLTCQHVTVMWSASHLEAFPSSASLIR